MTNKEVIEKLIFERAYELIEKSEEYRGILFPENASYEEIKKSALKQSLQEWKENKPVFNSVSL